MKACTRRTSRTSGSHNAPGNVSGAAQKRGSVAKSIDPRDAKIALLERKLRRAELICDVPKKVAALRGWQRATLADATLDEPTSK